MKTLKYTILKECACGPEELHVLLSLIDFNDEEQLRSLAVALGSLTEEGALEAQTGETRHTTIDPDVLLAFVGDRRAKGESLEDYPTVGQDYAFFTTELGLRSLSEEDRPIQR
jgi:hypothetical protein